MPDKSSMFPNQDTTTYVAAAPTEDWDAWKQTIPRDIALYKRLHTLIRRDTLAREEGDTPGTTAFAVTLGEDLVGDWTDSLAMNETRSERVEKLIREDYRGDEWDDEAERMVRLLANRIGHRARTARDALGNDDEEKVLEELEAIIGAASEIEG